MVVHENIFCGRLTALHSLPDSPYNKGVRKLPMTFINELLTEVKAIFKYIPTHLCDLATEMPATIAWLFGKEN